MAFYPVKVSHGYSSAFSPSFAVYFFLPMAECMCLDLWMRVGLQGSAEHSVTDFFLVWLSIISLRSLSLMASLILALNSERKSLSASGALFMAELTKYLKALVFLRTGSLLGKPPLCLNNCFLEKRRRLWRLMDSSLNFPMNSPCEAEVSIWVEWRLVLGCDLISFFSNVVVCG